MSGFFGISVRVVLVCLFSFSSCLYAANPYQLGGVDYFHDESQEKSLQKKQQPFDWREPSYAPPEIVSTLLNDPTPENARAYLDWQRQKIERIIKAQKMINQITKKEGQL